MVPLGEDAEIGALIEQLHASDRDMGENADLMYSITSGNEGGNLFM